MTKYKTPIALPAGSETRLCYYPLRVDTYGCGCSHNCLYCYAKTSLDFRGLWDAENARKASFNDIKKELLGGKNPYIQRRLPVRLGGMTDCFGNHEEDNKITEQVIRLLNSMKYPYLIITKNKLVADYLPILHKDLCIVQITITSPFDDISAIFESGASLSSERLTAGLKLAQGGIHTAARINPLFPIYPDEVFSSGVPIDNYEPLRYFDFTLPEMIADHGFKTLIAGFVRLSPFNMKWIDEAMGGSFKYLFLRQEKDNGTYYFSKEEIRYYYERIKGICDARGVDFSVCYDSDDNYREFQYLWANPQDCCNNHQKVLGFRNKFDNFNLTMRKEQT